MLKNDSFPRFIRDKNYNHIFEKYINNSNIMIPYIVYDYQYKDDDFKIFVNKKDIDFMIKISEENFNWILLNNENKNPNIFYSEKNVIFNIKLVFKRFKIM